MKALITALLLSSVMLMAQAAKPGAPASIDAATNQPSIVVNRPPPAPPVVTQTKDMTDEGKVAFLKMQNKALQEHLAALDAQVKMLQSLIQESQDNSKISNDMQALSIKLGCSRIAMLSADDPTPVCVVAPVPAPAAK